MTAGTLDAPGTNAGAGAPLPRRPGPRGSKTVAVVVPLSSRPTLTPDEEISLRHLRHYLGDFDKFMHAPASTRVSHDGFEMLYVDDRYFGSANAHTRLMMQPEYYEAFRDYEYILTYQLDALVFSDDLLEWCATGLDFISAPNYGLSDQLSMVCSGGFALRKVESFLDVFYSTRHSVDPDEYWRNFCATRPKLAQLVNLPRKYLKRLRYFNGVDREIRAFLNDPGTLLEDEFFVTRAPAYVPGFRVAPLETALRFAFDENPRAAFEMNHRRLPFGAHAWYKHDRAFWEPYLLT